MSITFAYNHGVTFWIDAFNLTAGRECRHVCPHGISFLSHSHNPYQMNLYFISITLKTISLWFTIENVPGFCVGQWRSSMFGPTPEPEAAGTYIDMSVVTQTGGFFRRRRHCLTERLCRTLWCGRAFRVSVHFPLGCRHQGQDDAVVVHFYRYAEVGVQFTSDAVDGVMATSSFHLFSSFLLNTENTKKPEHLIEENRDE